MQQLALQLLTHGDCAHADCAQFAWGHAFYDEKNPLCHAANHAVVREATQLGQALGDAQQFFTARGLMPRIHTFMPRQHLQAAQALLQQHGWQVFTPNTTVMVYNPSRLVTRTCHGVLRIRSLFGDAMDFALEMLSLWGAQALKRRLRMGEDCHLYMLMHQDFPIALTVLRYHTGGGATFGIIEDVAVVPHHRHQGVATQLVGHALQQHYQHHPGCALLLAAETALCSGLYAPLGFTPVTGLPAQLCAHMPDQSQLPLEEP